MIITLLLCRLFYHKDLLLRVLYILSALFLFWFPVKAQKVTVSPDISIRSDFAFHVIGSIDDRILLFKDNRSDRELFIYDKDLVLQSERQVNFLDNRAVLFEVVKADTAFATVYGYRDKSEIILQLDIFSPTAERLDSVELYRDERSYQALRYETVVSQDQSKIALYNISEKDKLKIVLIDVAKKELMHRNEYIIGNVNLYTELEQIELSNDGDFLILTERNNFKSSRDKHQASVFWFGPTGTDVKEILIPLEDIVSNDIHLSVDNKNKKVGIFGLYDEKRSKESSGYYWVYGQLSQWANQPIILQAIDPDILFELYGDQKQKRLENFIVADVLYKYDGTPIAILEMEANVSRQGATATNLNTRNSNFDRSYTGWSDHYNEDIVVLSLDNTGQRDWHQVFYKKQYSQNDQGIYSSFFPFKTPSRVRLLYNDEIKANSTVSEYIFDGAGNFKRTSVLSTEYQNLRLRFKDALQISNTALLVPSQKSYVLNLVKIDYTR